MPRSTPTARELAVSFLRPAWRRVWARIEARISPLDARLAALEAMGARVAALETADTHLTAIEAMGTRVAALEAAWRQHIPAFLNAVGTVPAFAQELSLLRDRVQQIGVRLDDEDADVHAIRERIGSVEEQIRSIEERMEQAGTRLDNTDARLDNADAGTRAIWERIEFVRREILFEMAHGGNGPPVTGAAPKTIARILSAGKIAAARANGALRLNLGCGHIVMPDYVNVDMRELPGVDVVAEAGDLPFERGGVDEIFSAHLLEHFPQEAMRRRLLPYWRDMLRPGGTFRAVTPDAAAMLAGAGAGTYDFEEFREVVFGAQDYAGDYHYNLFTPDSLRGLLEEAGFADITVPVVGRRNGKCFEFEISARRAG
jgi:predicted SAM-dependent methyltransferase